MTTINWDDGDDHVEIISLTPDEVFHQYRIRVKINGKFYVGYVEMNE